LNLFVTRADFHVVSKKYACIFQVSNAHRALAAIPEAPGPIKTNLRPPDLTWPKAGGFCITSLKPSVLNFLI
jgi:hypothetical protein